MKLSPRLACVSATAVLVGVCVSVVVGGSGVALAAGGHGEHAPSIGDLFFPAINFLLFLYVLRRAGAGAIRDYLTERRTELVEALDTAAKAKVAAEQAHAEARAQLGKVEQEVARLRADMREVTEGECRRRRQIAAEAATRIAEDAKLVADQESRSARMELRNETVKAAIVETMALLRRQIKGGDQERFLSDFVGEMGKSS
jgi:F-type H+-transporting ATPase subunit b